MDIWDTAGQEDFENIRTLSYPGTHCLLACYSTVSKTSLDNIKSLWIPEMKKTIPNTPFVLVGTKADLMDKMGRKAVLEAEAIKRGKEMKAFDQVQCSAMWFQDKEKSKVDQAFKLAISCALDRMHYSPGCMCVVL